MANECAANPEQQQHNYDQYDDSFFHANPSPPIVVRWTSS
jgi:hypothetical protein